MLNTQKYQHSFTNSSQNQKKDKKERYINGEFMQLWISFSIQYIYIVLFLPTMHRDLRILSALENDFGTRKKISSTLIVCFLLFHYVQYIYDDVASISYKDSLYNSYIYVVPFSSSQKKLIGIRSTFNLLNFHSLAAFVEIKYENSKGTNRNDQQHRKQLASLGISRINLYQTFFQCRKSEHQKVGGLIEEVKKFHFYYLFWLLVYIRE